MPFPILDKANKIPIATILKWYMERKKGKVVESRNEIQRRFGGLDWSIQKKVILAFLDSGKADRKWVYEQLIWFWDEAFQSKVREVFEKYHEKGCYWPVTWYFPTDYILEHFDELATDHNYYRLCYRLAYEKVKFKPDRRRLSPKEYLAIMEKAGYNVEDSEALDILFEVLHDLTTDRFSKYDGVSPRHKVEKGIPLRPSDFVYVYRLINQLCYLKCYEAVDNFTEWEAELHMNIYLSQEFKALNENDPDDYDDQRKIISKRYIYKMLPDKYKSPSDETPFASNREQFDKMKEKNQIISSLVDKLGLEIIDPVNF